jgi:hypothetical protein
MMMLSLTRTLLLADDDADDADNANDTNDADADDADDERRRRRSSIEKEKRSRLDTSLDRAERLVIRCSSAPLAASQAGPKNHQIRRLFHTLFFFK